MVRVKGMELLQVELCPYLTKSIEVNMHYLVLKDESQSVDMALWRAIGNKVKVVGKTIDGMEKASLGATAATAPLIALSETRRPAAEPPDDRRERGAAGLDEYSLPCCST